MNFNLNLDHIYNHMLNLKLNCKVVIIIHNFFLFPFIQQFIIFHLLEL